MIGVLALWLISLYENTEILSDESRKIIDWRQVRRGVRYWRNTLAPMTLDTIGKKMWQGYQFSYGIVPKMENLT